MRFEYENNKQDSIALTRYSIAVNKDYQRQRKWNLYINPVLLFIFLIIVFHITAQITQKKAFLYGGFIGTIVGCTITFLWYWRIYANHPKKLVENYLKQGNPKEVYCKHTIDMNKKGFTEKTRGSQSYQSWEAINKIVIHKDYIFVFNTPATAHMIPRREVGDVMFEKISLEIKKYHVCETWDQAL